MDFTQAGVGFLLGPYATKNNGFIFLIHSMPVIIFFTAIVSLFYHWGIIQRVVGAFSWVLRKFMNVSGAEGLVVSGNIFMGMTESPVLIKNYLPTMNRSEIFLVMVAGMGTIAGSVMATYIGMLSGGDPAGPFAFCQTFTVGFSDGCPRLYCNCQDVMSANRAGYRTGGEGFFRESTSQYIGSIGLGYFGWNKIGSKHCGDAVGVYFYGCTSELCIRRTYREIYRTK
jgi:Nucleoside permease